MVRNKVKIKRIYDPPAKSDGLRVLVDSVKDTVHNNAQVLQKFLKA